MSVYAQSSATSTSTTMRSRFNTNNSYEEYNPVTGVYDFGPQSYTSHDGFDMEPDEDDIEDCPPSCPLCSLFVALLSSLRISTSHQ